MFLAQVRVVAFLTRLADFQTRLVSWPLPAAGRALKVNPEGRTICTSTSSVKSASIDLVTLRQLISEEIGKVQESNASLQHKLTQAQQDVHKLQTQLAQITDLATIDELTGLYNRRALFSRLVEEHSRVERYKENFSLMIIDIDDFKNVNDTYGHQVGDAILKNLASFLKGNLRTSDFVSRFGGEEFIAILPSTDMTKAKRVAEKLRHMLGKKVFEDKKGEVKIKITVSVGISQCTPGDNIDSLIKRADDALYLAKDNGKNAIFTEEDLPTSN